jgi:hypothetical protein
LRSRLRPFQARLATQATGADVNGTVSVTFRVYSSLSGVQFGNIIAEFR